MSLNFHTAASGRRVVIFPREQRIALGKANVVGEDFMTRKSHANRARSVAKLALLSVSYLALNFSIATPSAQAQSAQAQSGGSLPAVTVTAPDAAKRRSNPSSASRSNSSARSRRTQTARRPETAPAEPKPFAHRRMSAPARLVITPTAHRLRLKATHRSSTFRSRLLS